MLNRGITTKGTTFYNEVTTAVNQILIDSLMTAVRNTKQQIDCFLILSRIVIKPSFCLIDLNVF